jgi:hypothetical protein
MQDAEKNGVLARFILTEEERNPAVEEVCNTRDTGRSAIMARVQPFWQHKWTHRVLLVGLDSGGCITCDCRSRQSMGTWCLCAAAAALATAQSCTR